MAGRKPRSVFSAEAPQLTLGGIGAPEAQGAWTFDDRPVASEQQHGCSSCGGPLALRRYLSGVDRCDRCEQVGVEPVQLAAVAHVEQVTGATVDELGDAILGLDDDGLAEVAADALAAAEAVCPDREDLCALPECDDPAGHQSPWCHQHHHAMASVTECHYCARAVESICPAGTREVGEPICHDCTRKLRDDSHAIIRGLCDHSGEDRFRDLI